MQQATIVAKLGGEDCLLTLFRYKEVTDIAGVAITIERFGGRPKTGQTMTVMPLPSTQVYAWAVFSNRKRPISHRPFCVQCRLTLLCAAA